MENTIREFKLWTLFLAVGVGFLATEIAVKATYSPVDELSSTGAFSAESTSDDMSVIPEELVADLLIESVVMVESGGRPRTIGSQGERGLMQIMEATWRDTTARVYGSPISFSRAFEPELNREIGSAYLAGLHQFLLENRGKWQGSERSLLLACYNAGPGRVAKSGFDIRRMPASTRDYIARASALHDMMLRKYRMKLERDRQSGELRIVQAHSSYDS